MTGAEENIRRRADALLEELLDIEAEEARQARLSEACAGDSELESEVRKLLRHAFEPPSGPLDEGLGGFWDGVAGDLGAPTAASAPAVVGPWELVRELGRGGMGTVYLGRRADGEFQQEAAIKLVRAEELGGEILRRFELERQILAGLDHPNIGRLLDGGRTADGQPYFAMEYVRGRSIGRYCDEERLTVRQRLELFQQVCRAVEHAHRRLVIHRDLKPSNIVVTDRGEVKLLDFGIAKLLGARPLDAEPLTETVLRVLTPEYASPEQIRGETITTSSDVYQLGLLLYELLTGQRVHRPKSRAIGDLEKTICEEEPTRPSLLVSSGEVDPSVAWSRRTQPEVLARRLHGDLDNIILMALRKEPERRYASASQLRDDIESHIQGRPVSARPLTVRYRMGKFLRRHAIAASAAAAFLVLLIGYAATATIQGREIRRERDRTAVEAARAKRVTSFLAGIFEAADPYRHRGDELTAGELLEAGSTAARSELTDDPEVLSELLLVLGSVSGSLGAVERAEELLTEALALRRELYPENHPEVARAQLLLASAVSERGEPERASELAGAALDSYREFYGPRHPDVAAAIAGLASAVLFGGDLDRAEKLFREEVALREGLGANDAQLARALNDLGSSIQRKGNYEEAEKYNRRALALRRFLFPPEHPDVSESLNNLAVSLRRQGRLEEAEPLYREALEIRRRVFGPRHVRVANTLNNLGELLRKQGRFADAESAHREALGIRREVLGDEHANVAMSLHNLGVVLRDSGRPELARQLLGEAWELFRRTLPAGHHVTAYSAVALGRLEVAGGRLDRASFLLEEALAIREAALGEEHLLTTEARLALGICRGAEGRSDEARALLTRSFAVLDGLTEEADEAIVDEALALRERLEAGV